MEQTEEHCQCKGINFLGFLKAAQQIYPDVPLEVLTATSPEPMRQLLLDGALLTGDWYPVDWYNSLHRNLRLATGKGPEIAWDIGFEGTRRDFSEGGLYRHVVRLLSPNTVFSLAPKIFGFYWRPGKMTTQKLGRKKALGHWQECHGFEASTWQDLLGSAAQILELSGAHEPTLKVISGGQDEPFMEAEATWL